MPFCQQFRDIHCFDVLNWRYCQRVEGSDLKCKFVSESVRLDVTDGEPEFAKSRWTVHSCSSFLGYVCRHGGKELRTKFSLDVALENYDLVIVFDVTVGITNDTLTQLLEKAEEYDCKSGWSVISASGYRLFPHFALDDPSQFWSDGTFVRYFGPSCSARAVHIFGSACCVIPGSLLDKQLTIPPPNGVAAAVIPEYWLSFRWQQQFGAAVWKVKVDLSVETVKDLYVGSSVPDIKKALEEMYQYHSSNNWPVDLHLPLPSLPTHASRSLRNEETSVWDVGFGGVNMISNPVKFDFEAAACYGVRVIRIGAIVTAYGRDLDYLICDYDCVPKEDLLFVNDSKQVHQNIKQLQQTLDQAERAGLKVIITLTQLPGREFDDSNDYRFWRNPLYFRRVVCLWGLLVNSLRDYKHILAGYDVINEPFTPEDARADEPRPVNSPEIELLNAFYSDVVKEIREYDKETMIILESTYWSSPEAFPFIQPVDDLHIVYSFHLYHPQVLTHRSKNTGRFKYPGEVPRWPGTWGGDKTFWNKDMLSSYLQPVTDFQNKFGINSKRILVGEFGISREITGAKQYLSDLMAIFKERGWSWCLYSFREPEWDSMDYELGSDIANMLHRHSSDLFLTVAEHFH